jgi:hypothetical protein
MYIQETCGELWSRLVSDGIVCTVNLLEWFMLSLPWRWPCEWLKHVCDYCVIKKNTIINSSEFFCPLKFCTWKWINWLMWVYELHDIWEECTASIFGVVMTRVGKYSGNEAGQSFKLKEGSRQSVASRSGRQVISTMQCVFTLNQPNIVFDCSCLKVLPVRTVACLGRQKNSDICIVMCSLDRKEYCK